jgi:hypothetical protein
MVEYAHENSRLMILWTILYHLSTILMSIFSHRLSTSHEHIQPWIVHNIINRLFFYEYIQPWIVHYIINQLF